MPSQNTHQTNGNTVNDYDQDSNIVRSKFPQPNYPNVSLSEYISERISSHPEDALAFIDPNNNCQITYGQLRRQIQQTASALLKLKLQSTDFLMFYAENSLEYCILVLATAYLGLSYCAVPPASGAFELTEQIKGANGSVLVFGGNKLHTIKKVLEDERYSDIFASYISTIIEIDVEDEQAHSLLKEHPVTKSKAVCSFSELYSLGSGKCLLSTIPHFPIDDPSTAPYLICFTSGTTGIPKAALHTHRSMLCTLYAHKIGLQEFGYRVALFHPIGHISGSIMLPHALDIGMTIVLFKEGDIDVIMETVPRLRINVIFFSPNQASPLVHNGYEKRYDLSSLTIFKTGGSKIADNLLISIKEKYNVKLFEMYGSTEMMCAVRVRDPEETKINYVPGNVGTVVPGCEMKIVDLSTGRPLPAYQTGEVCFRGEGCFSGYLNNEEATKKTIVDGWYHSGDVGYYDEGGRLFISDRIKEMIKYKLYSLIPAEIEDFLHRHRAVAAVCIVGVPHVSEGNYIRAYVELVKGETVTEQELIRYVAENMGTQKRLRAGVTFIDSMPRTLIGKIDRQYFKKLIANELITEIVL